VVRDVGYTAEYGKPDNRIRERPRSTSGTYQRRPIMRVAPVAREMTLVAADEFGRYTGFRAGSPCLGQPHQVGDTIRVDLPV
jgi:hypothetical protein